MQVVDCWQFITGGFGELSTVKRTRSLCSSAWDSNISLPNWKLKSDTWKLMSLIFEAITLSERGGPRKTLCLLQSVDWTVISSGSRSSWLLWIASCSILRQFLESKRRVSVLICGVLFCSFPVQFCVACVLKFLRDLVWVCRVDEVLTFPFCFFNKTTNFHFGCTFHFCLWKFLFGFWMCCPFSFFSVID